MDRLPAVPRCRLPATPLPPPRPSCPAAPRHGPPGTGHPGGFHPYPPALPPRRKSSNGPILALVLGGVAVLGIAAVGGFAATLNSKVRDAGYSNYTTYSPTYTSTSTTTTTTTTKPATTTRATTSTPPAQAGPKAVYKLADHPIFGSPNFGAYDIDACRLPQMEYSPAGEDRFLQAALPCIEKAWKPMFQKANLPYQPVEVQTHTGTIQTPCGDHTVNETAVYCRGVIYWPAGFYANEPNMVRHPGKYLGQLGHEYGHHVQWLSGMLRAADQAQYDVGGWDTPKGLELNRRLELQATCFGGMTLAPLSRNGVLPMDVINTGLQDAGQRGDYNRTPDHGSQPNNHRWVMHGHKQNKTSACNTWAASPADVA
ncbi:neutral zinc metallopeptidase [Lentzea guizhouensis]|uniref:neutral zinc metallopeptidase n=1 Tax=Lentzea guizhouensis TaxID=1586287 RepID=UPI000AE8E77E|nr:neutral zinc metallopeptidase [Lentzea guizhouensis]